MLTAPAARSTSRARRPSPSAVCIFWVRAGSAGTGTASSPAPRAPSRRSRTCHAPACISHKCPTKLCASSRSRRATSGTGDSFAPTPCAGSGTMVMRAPGSSGSATRAVTSAIPGTASGGRTVTRTRYGPAAPSKKTSGLPTCAHAVAGASAIARSTTSRFIA